jgi:hypothetical protein
MTKRKILLPAVAAIACLGLSSVAHADDDTMQTRVHLDALAGFTGDLHVDVEDGSDFSGDDLADSWGLRLGIEIPVIEIFTFGFETGWRTWDVDQSQLDRSHVIELTAIPRLRLPIEGENVHGALTAGVPLMVGVSILDDTVADSLVAGADLNRGGFATGTGVRVGAQLFLTETFGLNAEVGYEALWQRHGLENADDDRVWIRQNQVIVMAGFSLAI